MNESKWFIVSNTHLSHAESKKKPVFKYYAKIPITPKRNRYFYTREAYQAYLRNKNSKKDESNSKESKTADQKSSTANKSASEKITKATEVVKDFLSRNAETKSKSKTTDRSNPKIQNAITFIKDELSDFAQEKVDVIKKKINPPKKWTDSEKAENKQSFIDSNKRLEDTHKEYQRKKQEMKAREASKIIDEQNNARNLNRKLADLKENNPLPSLPLQTQYTTPEEDMSLVNPMYSSGNSSYRTNCALCSVTYDLRQRGYDVEAMGDYEAGIFTNASWIESCYTPPDGIENPFTDFRKAKIEEFKIKENNKSFIEKMRDSFNGDDPIIDYIDYMYDEYEFTPEEATEIVENALLAEGNGARGILNFYWKDGGGHAVAWEVRNNKAVIIDSQVGREIDLAYYMSYADMSGPGNYIRTDNREPTDECLNAVRKRKEKT